MIKYLYVYVVVSFFVNFISFLDGGFLVLKEDFVLFMLYLYICILNFIFKLDNKLMGLGEVDGESFVCFF